MRGMVNALGERSKLEEERADEMVEWIELFWVKGLSWMIRANGMVGWKEYFESRG